MVDTLLYVTLALFLVLALRKPARRLFGAGPAFTLWGLPLLLAAIPCLPSLPVAWVIVPTTMVSTNAHTLIDQTLPASSITKALLLLWLTGATLCVLRLVLRYARLLGETRALPADLARTLQADLTSTNQHLTSHRVRLHPNGPAVLWAPHSLLLIPPDFAQRFDSMERRLILRHEHTHLRRGDTWWSLLAELAAALLWFHPLVWLAMPCFRLDQELACDEQVLRRSPQDETKYAQTLMHSIGMGAEPVLIPWLAEPQLKERLTMIQRLRPGAMRRRIGFIALTALMTSTALMAEAAISNSSNFATHANPSVNATVDPQYPADAIKNHEEGMVLLDVLVGADGKVQNVKVDDKTEASSSLIKAASDAVMNWHFQPEMKNGKPVAAYAQVPVNFSLRDNTPPPPPPAPPLPPPPPPAPPAPPSPPSTSI